MKIATFLQKHRIRMAATLTDGNPHMTDMAPGSTHWMCVFRMGRHQMTVPFSQGPAITDEPTAATVLDCIARDAYAAELPFEEWARDMGHDSDSRKAEKIYKSCESQTRKLEAFLNHSQYVGAYDDLLWQVDRL